MDNFTDFSSVNEAATGFVRMAVEEFNTHKNWTNLVERYWTIIDERLGDPRSKMYLFMDTPLATAGMILTYLSWVLIIGPIYMRDRKPMNIKSTLIYYNAFQVILSSYMFYEHLMAGWLRGYNSFCQTVDYTDSPLSRRMLNLCYIYYLSKLSEFADTVFFVLRKSKKQITWLHLYHRMYLNSTSYINNYHIFKIQDSLTPLEAWILVKFIPGGNATFPNILNNFVHICMYFYYMLSAMGPQYQKFLWWKKYMTELQIAQFILCIGHCSRALWTGCEFPPFMSALLLLNALIFLGLFMNFYIHSYRLKNSSEKKID